MTKAWMCLFWCHIKVTVPKMVPSIYLTHGTDDLRHMYVSSTTSLLSYDHLKRPLMV